jgi:ElaA protein
VFLDLDEIDTKCFHFFGENEQSEVIACSRLIAPNLVYNEMSIGRVATAFKYRKIGVGKQFLEKSIDNIYSLFGKQPIKIGAQLYLKKFYESFGFVQQSDVYLEDGISHIKMIKF